MYEINAMALAYLHALLFILCVCAAGNTVHHPSQPKFSHSGILIFVLVAHLVVLEN